MQSTKHISQPSASLGLCTLCLGTREIKILAEGIPSEQNTQKTI